jgi:hypothetical protein
VTVVDALGEPVVLINNDGTPAYLAYSAKTYLGGVAPYHWLDFIDNRALYAGADVGNVTQATGYSFSRASQGYYTNSDGTLTLFGHNLCLHSQALDNAAWGLTTATRTTGIDDPAGGTTACTLTATSANGQILQAIGGSLGTGTNYTVSVYLRRRTGTGDVWIFNPNAGGITTVTLTSSWQRFSVTGLGAAATNSVGVRLATSGDAIDVAFAQLEVGSSASPYLPTTSAAVSALRRGDRGVLIEGSRTNLCLQSQTLDNASWQKARCSIVANQYTAPDATLTGDQLVEDTTSNSHPVFQTIASLANATAYTFSIYLLAVGRTSANIAFSNTAFSTGCNVTFTLSGAGTATPAGTISSTATITAVGGGWYRCTVTATSISAGSGDVYVQPFNGANSYLGNGLPAIGVWQADLQAGAFPSSPIPTTSAAVARSADSLSISDARSAPFTMFAEFEPVGTANQNDIIAYDTLTNGSGIYLTPTPAAWVRESSVTTAIATGGSAAVVGSVSRVAARFAVNDTLLCNAGTLGSADTSNSPPSTTVLKFAPSIFGGVQSVYLRRVAIIASGATNAQLQAMTPA